MGRLIAGLVALLAASGCMPGPPPGMAPASASVHAAEPSLVELARVDPGTDHRALLVVYPRTACSGSARAVFLDGHGRFLGAVAPGEAALLSVPSTDKTVLVISSVEITAPVGSWFAFDEVALAPAPSGVLLRSRRHSARQCASGQYAGTSLATKRELEAVLAEEEIVWFEPRVAEGQAWLDANRRRVEQVLLGRAGGVEPTAVAHVVVR